MLEVITIENKKDSEKSNDAIWKDQVIASFNSFYKQNNFSESIDKKSSLEQFWSFIKTDKIHLVIKQNKFIGFFINVTHKSNKELSFMVFSHPNACPLSLRSILKCALFRSFILVSKTPSLYENIEFVTWHPALVTVIKSLVPHVEVHYLNATYIICNITITQFIISLFNATISKYLENPQHLNENSYKILY